jgi:hypothetical protein
MIIDARFLPAEATIDTHVCIIGSGPAGITLAREFANQSFQVCLLESGGSEFDPDIQALSDGTAIGDPYPLSVVRGGGNLEVLPMRGKDKTAIENMAFAVCLWMKLTLNAETGCLTVVGRLGKQI